MPATPHGFWKLPVPADAGPRHLAVITGGEAEQTMLFLQDAAGWHVLALFQDELAGRTTALTLDRLLQSVTYLRMGGADLMDGADTERPGVEWAGYDREFEEQDAADETAADPAARLWILPATDGASVGLKLPGHPRYADAVAQFVDAGTARAAVDAVDALIGARRPGADRPAAD
ncbi:hypothetical protein [Micrococcus porci]|uniref:hypothetical protein n=1 Tax=Micrococcus porci TaxID=2856555 RepID=UPI003CF89109